MIHSPHFRGYNRAASELTRGQPDWREQFDIGAERPALTRRKRATLAASAGTELMARRATVAETDPTGLAAGDDRRRDDLAARVCRSATVACRRL